MTPQKMLYVPPVVITALLVLLDCPEQECREFMDLNGYPNPQYETHTVEAHLQHLRKHLRERLVAMKKDKIEALKAMISEEERDE